MTQTLMGVQTPSVSWSNPFAITYAEEVIELARLCGYNLRPWQRLILENWVAIDPDRLHPETGEPLWMHRSCSLAVSRQNGKSLNAYWRVIWGMIRRKEVVFWTAQDGTTLDETFEWFRELMDPNLDNPGPLAPYVAQCTRGNGSHKIRFKNGGRIRFAIRSKGKGRGPSPDVIVFDEAQHLKSSYLASLKNSMNAKPGSQAIYLGTPPDESSEGDFFEGHREKTIAQKPKLFCWHEWSATKRADGSHIDDPWEWAQANPSLGYGTVTLETLQLARLEMVNPEEFCREVLCMFGTTSVASIISEDLFRALTVKVSRVVGDRVLAIDVSNDLSRASVSAAGLRRDGTPFVEVIQNDADTHWVVDLVERALAKQDYKGVVLDAQSNATVFLDEFKRRGIRVSTTNMKQMVNACALFYTSSKNGQLAHSGQDWLAASLKRTAKRAAGGGWAYTPKRAGDDITAMVSATLAVWGATTTDRLRTPKYAGVEAEGTDDPYGDNFMPQFA